MFIFQVTITEERKAAAEAVAAALTEHSEIWAVGVSGCSAGFCSMYCSRGPAPTGLSPHFWVSESDFTSAHRGLAYDERPQECDEAHRDLTQLHDKPPVPTSAGFCSIYCTWGPAPTGMSPHFWVSEPDFTSAHTGLEYDEKASGLR